MSSNLTAPIQVSMRIYIANYFDDIRDHLREALDALAYCFCSAFCFIVLILTLPILMVYLPIKDLFVFLRNRSNKTP